jgi:hypothetical protein
MITPVRIMDRTPRKIPVMAAERLLDFKLNAPSMIAGILVASAHPPGIIEVKVLIIPRTSETIAQFDLSWNVFPNPSRERVDRVIGDELFPATGFRTASESGSTTTVTV